MRATFTSMTGKEVTVEHVTECESIADHNRMVKCNYIWVRFDRELKSDFTLRNFDGYGLCLYREEKTANRVLKWMGIPIPEDAREAVQAIFDARAAEEERQRARDKRAEEADRRVEANRRAVYRAMDAGEDRQ